MTFFVVSLPSIDTRYTAQWYSMVERFIKDTKRTDIRLLGSPAPHTVRPTEFLNYREYFAYVWPQILEALNQAQNGDTVFFMDGETAGAEALEYVRKMEGLDLRVRMFWHSGSYDANDLPFVRGVRGESFERGWFDMCERVYVGSEYHKRALHEKRQVDLSKIVVTGDPLDFEGLPDGSRTPKTRHFLYAGRKVAEKGYDLVRALQAQGVPIGVSLDYAWSKKEYYAQIAQTSMMVIPAKHELFGYTMMEAFAMNVPCMVPDEGMFATAVPQRYRVPFGTFGDPKAFLRAAIAILEVAGNEQTIAAPFEFHKVLNVWFG